MKRWLLTGVLAMWAALVSAQSGDVSAADDPIDVLPPDLSIALPNQWLILQPGEVVTFVANPVLEGMDRQVYPPAPEYRHLIEEMGEVWTSNWYAFHGTVLDVSKGRVVYQAPSLDEGAFDVLIWHNKETNQYAAIGITLVCEAEVVALKAEKIEQEESPVYRVPTSSNAGVQLFALQQGGGGGFSICLRGRPLNPRPTRCSGRNFTTTTTKYFLRCTPWKFRGRVTVDASLAAKVRRIFGITLRVGAVFDIYVRQCTKTILKIQDCYECRNSVPVYVGTRVFFWSKTWWEIMPNWAVLVYPLPPPSYHSGCVSSGNCPC